LAGLTKNSPAMITNKTMNSLSATSARLTRSDSLIPITVSTVRIPTSTMAGRSTTEFSPAPSASGQVMPNWSSSKVK